ncbi:MAG TPA: RNA polymerase Rpb4 [Candidatus Bathyarchaeota archaeon]|nr:RNA polymerase Rpb4 [Candidatus Bathyarchaeota archaeon]
MSKRVVKEKLLTIAEVKELLSSIGEEKLDQFQRRTLDYAMKFSNIEDAKKARELVERLVNEFELKEPEAIQLVNCMPRSVEEIRVFLGGGKKIIKVEKLEAILSLLDEYRAE